MTTRDTYAKGEYYNDGLNAFTRPRKEQQIKNKATAVATFARLKRARKNKNRKSK